MPRITTQLPLFRKINQVRYLIAHWGCFQTQTICDFTAWKVSKYGFFSGPYFPAFELNTERYEVSFRIQSECGKLRTRKNSVFGHISHSAASLGAFFAMINTRGVFRTQSTTLATYLRYPVNYFFKKALSYTFGWVLSTLFKTCLLPLHYSFLINVSSRNYLCISSRMYIFIAKPSHGM